MAGQEILVEAPTATQALEEVTSRLGPRATIVEASKVTRGGIGGFFAREMVQLRAQPPTAPEPPTAPQPPAAPQPLAAPQQTAAPQPPATVTGPASGQVGDPDDGSVTTTAGDQPALDRLLTDLSSQVGEREETFATALRRHLGTGSPPSPPAIEPEPAPLADGAMDFKHALAAVRLGASPPAAGAQAAQPGTQQPRSHGPATRQATAHLAGVVHWSADRLVRLGVPVGLLEGWQDQSDDLDGLVAFAGLVAPLCGPLPAGPALVAGPRAHRLASRLGLPSVTTAERPPAAGSVCARLSGSGKARAWLDAHRAGRWLHVVTGGSGWQRLLLAYPQAVSWCGAEALPDALRVASELGVPLGYGTTSSRAARIVAATPVVVAIAVRDLLEAP